MSATWRSGAYYGGSDALRTAQMGVWRGRSIDLMMSFIDTSSWNGLQMTNSTWTFIKSASNPYRNKMVIATGMIPSTGGATMANGAAGDYDTFWSQFGARLVAAGMSNAIIRIGHEHNGNWYPWSSIPSPANYATYYQKIVTAMRGVAGQQFKFSWCNAVPSDKTSTPEAAYPGDAYVDYVTIDMYDTHYGKSESAAARFAYMTAGAPRGANYWRTFADAHGKPLGLEEWGVVNLGASMSGPSGGTSGAGGDDPYYFQALGDWILATGSFDYETYFNQNAGDGHHFLTRAIDANTLGDSTEFPNSAIAYKAYIASIGNTAPPPPPPPAPVGTGVLGRGLVGSYAG